MESLFVQTTVFNPDLQGKAVRIKGHDVDGDKWDEKFLVEKVQGECIYLRNYYGMVKCLHMENFETEGHLKISVWEEEE